jgi:hypothetical protein
MPVVRPVWMNDAMYQQWLGYYEEQGGTNVAGAGNAATEQFRASPEYATYFPGIKREDGQIRYPDRPEITYAANLAAFRQTAEDVGVNPEYLESEFISLIEGDVSPNEYQARVSNVYNRVLETAPEIREWYADNFGVRMSDAGILASIMSPGIGDDIINKNITMAEIGGEAAQRDFDITTGFVDMLADQGFDRGEANRLFGSAARMLPMLGQLAARHADPDSDFDLAEFTDAYLNDPEQQRRIQRLKAQEASTFTGGAQLEYARDQAGGVAGLAVQ